MVSGWPVRSRRMMVSSRPRVVVAASASAHRATHRSRVVRITMCNALAVVVAIARRAGGHNTEFDGYKTT